MKWNDLFSHISFQPVKECTSHYRLHMVDPVQYRIVKGLKIDQNKISSLYGRIETIGV